MQEQFDIQNEEETRASSLKAEQNFPTEGSAVSDAAPAALMGENSDLPFEETDVPDIDAQKLQKKEEAREKLRFAANRIGWATTVLMAVWMGMIFCVSGFLGVLEIIGEAGLLRFSAEAFYNRYALIINELTLAVGIAVAVAILDSVRRVELNREKVSVGRFMVILLMCFGAGYVGSMIGTRILSFWNLFTGNSAGDEIVTLLSDVNPLIMLVSVGILAPILEELFFRKFLTERLRMFGETTAILFSAFLFALFHQSAEQILYAFAVGTLLGYFYCRSGNYWLTVLLHAIFNIVSGVIPMLFLPKINEFLIKMQETFGLTSEALENVDGLELLKMMMPLLSEYGLVLSLYMLYALIVFAVNIAGVVLLIVRLKKFKARKGEYCLSFGESMKTVFKTPGLIVCTVVLGILTFTSLFS